MKPNRTSLRIERHPLVIAGMFPAPRLRPGLGERCSRAEESDGGQEWTSAWGWARNSADTMVSRGNARQYWALTAVHPVGHPIHVYSETGPTPLCPSSFSSSPITLRNKVSGRQEGGKTLIFNLPSLTPYGVSLPKRVSAEQPFHATL